MYVRSITINGVQSTSLTKVLWFKRKKTLTDILLQENNQLWGRIYLLSYYSFKLGVIWCMWHVTVMLNKRLKHHLIIYVAS